MSYMKLKDGKFGFHVDAPKTQAGIRIIPMLQEVRNALLNEKNRQLNEGIRSVSVDGYSVFVFFSKSGKPIDKVEIDGAIVRICRAYNNKEIQTAQQEQREPKLLPHFSVHYLRHTFCTRFCENESNLYNGPKNLDQK